MELVRSFDQNSREHDAFLKDLSLYSDDIPFLKEEVDRVHNVKITTINSRISQETTRYNGFVLLEQVLPRCERETLQKHGLLWLAKATQVLENTHSNVGQLTLACKIAASLITQCKEIPDLHKQISMHNVKQLINSIVNIKENVRCGAVYYLIATLLYRYPEVCERFQVPIRKLVLCQLDSTQKNLIGAGAKCYALLSRATERSFKPPLTKPDYTGWTYNEALLCNTLHSIMDELFSGLLELKTVDIGDKLEIPPVSDTDIIGHYFQQKKRFVNLCTYLSTMLHGYEAKNSVCSTDILKLLCRGLAVVPTNFKCRDSFKEQILYLILPKLHVGLLEVLSAFINGFRQDLISYGSTILQLLLQTLQWTENISENKITISNAKPFKNVRISVYKCLTTWLMFLNSASGIETIADECLSCILKDITPEKSTVLLTVQNVQHLSKRALKRHRESQYNKNATAQSTISANAVCLNTNLCIEALITLQHIFTSGVLWLKQSFYKNVQNIIIPLLYDVYLDISQEIFYTKNTTCRLHLLRTLRILEMNPHCITPPPTQYSIELFEMALNDHYVDIIQEAKLALAEIEKIVHPIARTLKLTKTENINETVENSILEAAMLLNHTNRNGNDETLSEGLTTLPEKRRKTLENIREDSTNNTREINNTINSAGHDSSQNQCNSEDNSLMDNEFASNVAATTDLPANNNKDLERVNGVTANHPTNDNEHFQSINTVSNDSAIELPTVSEVIDKSLCTTANANGSDDLDEEVIKDIQIETVKQANRRETASALITSSDTVSKDIEIVRAVEDMEATEDLLLLFCDQPKDAN